LIVWALLITGLVIGRWSGVFAPLWLADSDDVMRLQQVHDVLAGQRWYDVTQYRLEPPRGGSMQWSRLADLGLLAIHAAASPFTSHIWTDRLTVILYPALMMLGWLVTVVWAGERLSGKIGGIAALFVAITMASVRFQFEPGRIDHHSLQILGFAIAFVLCVAGRSRRAGVVAGIGMAVSLGTGLEALAYVAALHLCLWLRWSRSTIDSAFLGGLGFGLIWATLTVVALTLPPDRWPIGINDGFGRGHAMLLISAGAYWLAMSRFKLNWALSGGAALVMVGALAMLFPELRTAPYQNMDPLVKTLFLDKVQEAAPFWREWQTNRSSALIDLGVTLTGLGASLWLARRARGLARDQWLMVGILLTTALGIAMWQSRAFAYAGVIATVPIACLIAAIGWQSGQRPLFRVCAWIFPTAIGWGIIAQCLALVSRADPAGDAKTVQANSARDSRSCTLAEQYATLATQRRGNVLSLVDMGARVIAHTPHSAIAAPYHRNEQGLRDTILFFSGDSETARKIAARRNVTYVVFCTAMPELKNYRVSAPKGFLVQLADGTVPDWLEPISVAKNNPLIMYRVKPQAKMRP
jgi:hypothetical protein